MAPALLLASAGNTAFLVIFGIFVVALFAVVVIVIMRAVRRGIAGRKRGGPPGTQMQPPTVPRRIVVSNTADGGVPGSSFDGDAARNDTTANGTAGDGKHFEGAPAPSFTERVRARWAQRRHGGNGHPRVPERTAFVLAGGGSRGAVQVGMLQELTRRGIRADRVYGASVGAINGASYAGQPTLENAERMADIWRALKGTDIFPRGPLDGPWAFLQKRPSVHANTGLRAIIEAGIDYEYLEEATIPIEVVTTSLTDGRERWIGHGPAVEAILASSAIPSIFPPVIIDGDMLVDGGVVNNVPISQAIGRAATASTCSCAGRCTTTRRRPAARSKHNSPRSSWPSTPASSASWRHSRPASRWSSSAEAASRPGSTATSPGRRPSSRRAGPRWPPCWTATSGPPSTSPTPRRPRPPAHRTVPGRRPGARADLDAVVAVSTGRYLLSNDAPEAMDRFTAFTTLFDPATFRHLDGLGLAAGWRCWEVGAGGTSVVTFLSGRVGPAGHVLASDINVAWAGEAVAPNVEVGSTMWWPIRPRPDPSTWSMPAWSSSTCPSATPCGHNGRRPAPRRGAAGGGRRPGVAATELPRRDRARPGAGQPHPPRLPRPCWPTAAWSWPTAAACPAACGPPGWSRWAPMPPSR